MKLFSKQKNDLDWREDPAVVQTARIEVYKVELYWDIDKATNEYACYEATEVHFSNGVKSIYADPFSSSSDDEGWTIIAKGNKAWADRTRRHYESLGTLRIKI